MRFIYSFITALVNMRGRKKEMLPFCINNRYFKKMIFIKCVRCCFN